MFQWMEAVLAVLTGAQQRLWWPGPGACAGVRVESSGQVVQNASRVGPAAEPKVDVQLGLNRQP